MSHLLDRLILRLIALLESLDRRRWGEELGAPARLELHDVFAEGARIARRYRLESVLGEGGMGRVWLANDTERKETVVLKELRAAARAESERLQSELELAFKREFYTMTKLQHPNTVGVFDSGVLPGGDFYIAMEYVDGRDLSEILAGPPMEPERVVRHLIELVRVLGFIHSRLFVHCDIKADNIRITKDGRLKLMDFGVMHQLGTPGALKGTPQYMAPEIFRGGVIDARTDLYAVGVLAFKMLTGHLPFDGHTLEELAHRHLSVAPPRLSAYRAIDPELEDLVLRLLAKDPDERYPSCQALLAELAELTDEPVEEPDYSSQVSYLYCPKLIGRADAQQKLSHALERLGEGEGRSLFVAGVAGVGKTRLIQEFRLEAKLADIPFCVGTARAEGQAPLAAIREALRQLVAHSPESSLERHRDVLAHLLPSLREARADAPEERAPPKGVIYQTLGRWLREIAAVRPFILCLEDLHWADAGTVELMNVVIRALDDTAGMVLATYRPDEVDGLPRLHQTVYDKLADAIELEPLTRAHTEELIRSMLGGLDVDVKFLDGLYATTRGNAFFITELLRLLIEQQTLVLRTGVWVTTRDVAELSLPASIAEAASQRLSTLGEESLRLCHAIAPLGRLLEMPVLMRLVDADEQRLFNVLGELVQRQFVQRSDNQFYFAHDTVRETVYRSMDEAARRDAHQQIGEVLEALYADALEKHAPQLGYHYARGHDAHKAVGYLELAGSQAASEGQLRAAAETLAEASEIVETLDLEDRDARLVGLWSRIVQFGHTWHPPHAVKYGDRLFSHWESRFDIRAATARFRQRTRELAARDDEAAKAELERLWGDAPLDPASDDEMHVVPRYFLFRNMQLISLSFFGQQERMYGIIDEVYDQENTEPFRVAGRMTAGISLMNSGQWGVLAQIAGEARERLEEHLETIGTMPMPLRVSYIASHHFMTLEQAMTGRDIDAQVWQRGYDLADRYGILEIRWLLRGSHGVLASLRADPDRFDEVYPWLVDELRRLGNPMMLESRLPIWVGMYWIQRAEERAGDDICTKIEGWADKLPQDEWLPRYAMAYRALWAAQHAPLEQAEAAADEALERAEQAEDFRLFVQLLCARADLFRRRGDLEQAQSLARRALDRATDARTASVWDELVALRTLGEATPGEAGRDAIARSISRSEETGNTFHEAMARFILARRLSTQDRNAARAELERARALFEALRCEEWIERLERFRLRAGRQTVEV